MTESTIMSVKEMIAKAFGERTEIKKKNYVDFKLVQAVLYILAQQLRLLERQVGVHIDYLPASRSTSSITVTEVQITAKVPVKRRVSLLKKSTSKILDSAGSGHRLLKQAITAKPTVVRDNEDESKTSRPSELLIRDVEEAITSRPSEQDEYEEEETEEGKAPVEKLGLKLSDALTGIRKEKLLILQRKLQDTELKGEVDDFGQPIPNIVTREQYEKLLGEVVEIENEFGPIDWKTLTITRKVKHPKKTITDFDLDGRIARAENALVEMEQTLKEMIEQKKANQAANIEMIEKQKAEPTKVVIIKTEVTEETK